MRALRLTMLGVTALLVSMSALFWTRGVDFADFAVENAVTVHYLGHRTYFIEVGAAAPRSLGRAMPA